MRTKGTCRFIKFARATEQDTAVIARGERANEAIPLREPTEKHYIEFSTLLLCNTDE